ncbi:hypothetical protein [Cellulosimicrobium sp. Marseille-Q4280]|uniref:hypothetical protein n=1 Tax=Cellulosimicrobium sp. Marseille-Q4280 TaxID=2937992 RepID=UPI00203F1B18|nr:hypothetical protein [Cellulosimicrobium sp. Marseille-Q4280]
MSAPTQARVPAGVTTGGQFSTSAKSEADVILARDAKLDLPDGHEVAFRNPLSAHPKWMHGVITRDAPLSLGQLGVTVGEGEQTNTYILDAGSILASIEPAEYDGDDADTMAEAFGWSSDDWGYYYDGRAERDQTGAYRNGLDDGLAQAAEARTDTGDVLAILDGLNSRGEIEHSDYSALHDAVSNLAPADGELTHPSGAGRVTTYVGEADGVPVFQIDTDAPGRIRINLNDGTPVYDGDPEGAPERNANHVLDESVGNLRAALNSGGDPAARLARLEELVANLESAGWGGDEDDEG